MYQERLRFSLWADFIERDFLDGEFKELVNEGIINGATSNPAIFKEAILHSPAYKRQLATLQGSPKEKYEALAIYDIQKAADVLRPLYDRGDDGYVSIEVDPNLCDDAQGTIEEGKRLFWAIARPNVMIKVPATPAGYEAMEALSAASIPVNATLVFQEEQARSCAAAFTRGARKAHTIVDTVISVFVSRLDRALDALCRENSIPTGKTGIYNASVCYEAVESLAVPNCRVLFASTGVKGDDYEPEYYIRELLAKNTVNTAPIHTIRAFVAHTSQEPKLPIRQDVIQTHFQRLQNAGVDLKNVLQRQVQEGLAAFKIAFNDILEAL